MTVAETQATSSNTLHTDSSTSESTAPSSPVFVASSGRINSTVRFSSGLSMNRSDSSQSLRSESLPTSTSHSSVHEAAQPVLIDRHTSSGSMFSRPGSGYASSILFKRPISTQSTLHLRRPYPSTRLEGEIEKPWTKFPDPAHRWARVIFWVLVAAGFAAGGVST